MPSSIVSKEDIERMVSGKDLVKAWMGGTVGSGWVLSTEPGDRKRMEDALRKVKNVVPGFEVPSDQAEAAEAFSALMDILDETISRNCERIGYMKIEELREEEELFKCELPSVGKFYVMRSTNMLVPGYRLRVTSISKNRDEITESYIKVVKAFTTGRPW